VPDDRPAREDELAALRAANARLRAAAEAKDIEIAALEAGQARQAEVIRRLALRVAELERRLRMDSGNSSTPPSKEPLGATARRKAARQASLRERSKQRRPGGQPGHAGAGLEPGRNPDRTEQAEPPAECRSCGAGLAGAEDAGRGWGQVWDIPPVRLEKVHWLLPKLRCGACGKIATADPPGGRAGTVAYGPNVNAAAVLLGRGQRPGRADREADGGAAGRTSIGRVRGPRPRAARAAAGSRRVRCGNEGRAARRASPVRR
jgi:uncharacterized protein DUF6444